MRELNPRRRPRHRALIPALCAMLAAAAVLAAPPAGSTARADAPAVEAATGWGSTVVAPATSDLPWGIRAETDGTVLVLQTSVALVPADLDGYDDVYAIDLRSGGRRHLGPTSPPGHPYRVHLDALSADGTVAAIRTDDPIATGESLTPLLDVTFLVDPTTGSMERLPLPPVGPDQTATGAVQAISDDGDMLVATWSIVSRPWSVADQGLVVVDRSGPTPTFVPLPVTVAEAYDTDADGSTVLVRSSDVLQRFDVASGSLTDLPVAGPPADEGFDALGRSRPQLTADGTEVVTLRRGSEGEEVVHHDVATDTTTVLVPASGPGWRSVARLRASTDGTRLVVDVIDGEQDRSPLHVDVTSGERHLLKPALPPHPPWAQLATSTVRALSPDGRTVLATVDDRRFPDHLVAWGLPPADDAWCTEAPGTAPFPDVDTDHPFAPDIAWLRCAGITRVEQGAFETGAPTSRQAFAAFLARMQEPTADISRIGPHLTDPYRDIALDNPLRDGILLATTWGMLSGYDDGTFRPAADVTRQAAAAALYRRAGSPDGDEPTCTTAPFSDVGTDHPFCGEIAWLASTGITTGWPDGTFRGGQPIERQAIAAMLHRFDQGPGAASP